jgi:hypothetical protein
MKEILTLIDMRSIIYDKIIYWVQKQLKKKLIPIIVTAVVLGVLIPILVLNSKPAEERLIADVLVSAKDAYSEQSDWVSPGQHRTITSGGSIIADIAVTLKDVTIQTEEGDYRLSFSAGQSYWKKIIKGVEISVGLYQKTHEEMFHDMPYIPIAAMLNGRGWIALTQSEKRDNVQVVLDYKPELKTSKVQSVDQIVGMLDTFYSNIANRDMSTLDALEKLLLNK